MRRVALGIVVGALAAVGADLLDHRRLPLLTPLLGLLAGLVVGALVGWRAPRPGVAALLGAFAGVLAGTLLLAGVSLGGALHTRLLAGAALVAALLCVALGAACAGLTSGWTGYGRRPRGVGEQPAPEGASEPSGPAPRYPLKR